MPVPKAYLIFFIALAFLGAAINIQAGWLYILVSVLLGFLLISWIETWRSVSPLEISLYLPDLLEAGKEYPYTLSVKGRDTSKKGSVEMIFSSPFEAKKLTRFFQLLPVEQATFHGSVNPSRRGAYSISRVDCYFLGRMGLFRWKKKISITKPKKILVHPPLYPVSRTLFAESETQLWNVGTQPRAGEGSDLFYGIREYGPRDTLQRIHWKSLARTGKVMVKQFQPERPQRISLIFDNAGHGTPEEFERAAILGVNLCRHLLKSGYSLHLLEMKGVHQFRSEEQLQEVLAYFARVGREEGGKEELVTRSLPQVEGRFIAIFQGADMTESKLLAALLPPRSHLILLTESRGLAEPFRAMGMTVETILPGQQIRSFLEGLA